MSVRFWKQLSALRRISPKSIRLEADRPFSVALIGASEELRCWSEVLVPAGLSERKRDQALKRLFTVSLPVTPGYADMLPQFDLRLATPSGAAAVRSLSDDYIVIPASPAIEPDWAARLAEQILEERGELALALGRHYLPLRDAIVERYISKIARENAAFAMASALPNVIPSTIELPWAIGEFASDTAFITGNQFRMAFLIAAASDSAVGWAEQKGQLGSIFGSAFGWRALARELSGKIPAGGGLVAKGLIAYSGTIAVGRGLDRFHRIGRQLTRIEKKQAYNQAYRTGRKVVEEIARKLIGRAGTTPA